MYVGECVCVCVRRGGAQRHWGLCVCVRACVCVCEREREREREREVVFERGGDRKT